jgi:hypothetical protein
MYKKEIPTTFMVMAGAMYQEPSMPMKQIQYLVTSLIEDKVNQQNRLFFGGRC